MKRAALFTIATLASVSCLAQPYPAEVTRSAGGITPEEIEAHVSFLADDLLEGRDTGSRGHRIAARYVASQFLECGIAPGGDDGSWFQPVPLRSSSLESGSMSFATPGRPWTELKWKEDFVVQALPEKTASTVEADTAFVGFGVTAPELDWDDYSGVDVRGKIVIALRNAPSRFPSSQRAHYASTGEKRRNAAAHGARGLIELATPSEERRIPWRVLAGYSDHPTMSWLESGGEIHEGFQGLEAHARISHGGAEKLFERSPTKLEIVFERAEAGKSTGSFSLPSKVRITTKSSHRELDSPNVVGVLQGSDPALRHEFVVLVAHLDHIGIGHPVNGDSIYNGAYDNASGVATMLAVAKALAGLETRPARSIAFLAVTGEERGLLGADYFAHHPTEPVDEVVAAFSLDMFLMLFPLHDVVAFGAEHSSLGESVERAAEELGISVSPDPVPEEVLFVRTDHYPFVKVGIPALYLDHGLDSGNNEVDGARLVRQWMTSTYHRPSDDPDQTFDWQAGADFAKLNLFLSWDVANQPKRPEWNEGDFFGERFGRTPR